MPFTIIIVLIIVLVLLAIGVNAIQQHKQRQELERRQKVARYRHILDESETLINNAVSFPVGRSLIYVLHARARDALQNLVEASPKNKSYQDRLRDYQENMKNLKPDDHSLMTESFVLPESDKQIITMIQSLKKLRAVLKSEHARGRVDSQNFHEEDRRLEFTQLRINVESLVRRADTAFKSNKTGSARQYYEKALTTLKDQDYSNDYITENKQKIQNRLEEITTSLREENSRDAAERAKDVDELDELFQPKKKW
ncbi:hypothetical protein CWE09_05075 [Aliidiomarina minuta]|uniref:DNA repair protein n=1 Tax=Aliidiomarina minuta TaxID=880057 RepID=A0A432W7N8_9GAMM|nr:hypothetical protein [Aliidiomarina minuta]RUO26100.1 hypothetical protein CWE09_05075 [Aliidiomarina minuta]